METKRQIKTRKTKTVDVDALTVDQIRGLLRSGDHKLIADIAGFSQDYVGKILDSNDKRTNEYVIEVARLLLKNRQFVIEKAALLKKQYELKRSNNGI